MPAGPNIQFRDDHIHVELPPDYEFDPAGSNNVWAQIKALADEHHTSRVLVEGYLPSGERNTSEVISGGHRTATVPHLWLAFHVENYQRSEMSELFEVIASSKGVRVKHFADRDHALMWLRNNAPS